MNDLDALRESLTSHVASLHQKLDAQIALGRITATETARRSQPFAADGAAGKFVTPNTARGVVRFLHNPTAANLAVTLFDGSNTAQNPEFSGTLAPGESLFVFVVFRTGLFCSAGNNAVISGEYDA